MFTAAAHHHLLALRLALLLVLLALPQGTLATWQEARLVREVVRPATSRSPALLAARHTGVYGGERFVATLAPSHQHHHHHHPFRVDSTTVGGRSWSGKRPEGGENGLVLTLPLGEPWVILNEPEAGGWSVQEVRRGGRRLAFALASPTELVLLDPASSSSSYASHAPPEQTDTVCASIQAHGQAVSWTGTSASLPPNTSRARHLANAYTLTFEEACVPMEVVLSLAFLDAGKGWALFLPPPTTTPRNRPDPAAASGRAPPLPLGQESSFLSFSSSRNGLGDDSPTYPSFGVDARD
jgi:hypothetical protein